MSVHAEASAALRTRVHVALAAAFAAIVLWNAWVTEDAYITFRTADNLVNGYGLRWNVAERVQSYTCPLWLLLFSAAYWVTREAYYTSLMLGAGLSLAAFVLVLRLGTRSLAAALFAALALGGSKAFIDFSTAGMENALAHLLVVAFFSVYLSGRGGRARMPALAILASLAMVNRLDAMPLLAPPLAIELWARRRRPREIALAMAGALPLLCWELFALIYYGFLLPNTAYAKLDSPWSRMETIARGLWYCVDSLARDWITLPLILVAALAGLAARRPPLVAGAIGVLAQLAYIVWIGGDFMSGRFLTTPFCAAVLLLLHGSVRYPRTLVPAGLAVLSFAGGLNLSGPIVNRPFFREYALAEAVDAHGIADERAFYFSTCGLPKALDHEAMPAFRWRTDGETYAADAAREGRLVTSLLNVGFAGYFAGPRVHIIDLLALADPFLARLPPRRDVAQRVGHLLRELPEGYVASVESDRNELVDAKLRELYDDLTRITRGPLWDPARWRAIWRRNTG